MQKSILFTILSTTIISLFLITGYSFADGDGHSLDAADGDPTDVVYVDNDGNVGVGTNSPLTDFHILGSSNSDILSIADGTLRWRFGTDSLNDLYLDPSSVVNRNVYMKNSGAGNTNLLIDGNLGIGTNSPANKLHIDGGGSDARIQLTNNSTGSTLTDGTWVGIDTNGAYIRNIENTDMSLYTNNAIRFFIGNTGNVGIGTTEPGSLLDVGGWTGKPGDVFGIGANIKSDLFMGNTGSNIGRARLSSNSNQGFFSWNSYYTGSGLVAMDTAKSSWRIILDGNTDYMSFDRAPATAGYQIWSTKIKIDSSGNVGIGTTSPQSKLAVNGTITTKEVNVPESGWSDFVFEEDYSLPTLDHIESYIKENKHLPDIPPAKEIKENGLSMAEMMAKQMQKIEELTLYVIDQNKKVEAQNKQIEELKEELAELKNMN